MKTTTSSKLEMVSAQVPSRIAIIGAGPAGLMAAQVLAESGAGLQIDVYDAMPSVGRKFLLAGRGGLNLTHAEGLPPHDLERFASRFAERSPQVREWLRAFTPQNLRDWAAKLGAETFVGSSNRVFPVGMKASPLLRAWLKHLSSLGVRIHVRHRWLGFSAEGSLRIASPEGELAVPADATILALGGASWQRLGSDGAWVPLLQAAGVSIQPLAPANCGFDVAQPWSEHLRQFAGQPLKSIAIHAPGFSRPGECVLTETGLEGSLIYAASAALRREIEAQGQATLRMDLLPAKSAPEVLKEVSHPRGSKSLSSHLKSRLNLQGLKVALLHELLTKTQLQSPAELASAIKALPISLARPRPIDEAISTAGGIALEALSPDLELKALPGVFAAGEMLDWEAPTGGYLLNGCLASGVVAAQGALRALLSPSRWK